MVTKVIMPKFGLSMETGVLGSWLVEEGASVTKGSALAEITTDKITNTCESPKDGILRRILLPRPFCHFNIALSILAFHCLGLLQPGDAENTYRTVPPRNGFL